MCQSGNTLRVFWNLAAKTSRGSILRPNSCSLHAFIPKAIHYVYRKLSEWIQFIQLPLFSVLWLKFVTAVYYFGRLLVNRSTNKISWLLWCWYRCTNYAIADVHPYNNLKLSGCLYYIDCFVLLEEQISIGKNQKSMRSEMMRSSI